MRMMCWQRFQIPVLNDIVHLALIATVQLLLHTYEVLQLPCQLRQNTYRATAWCGFDKYSSGFLEFCTKTKHFIPLTTTRTLHSCLIMKLLLFIGESKWSVWKLYAACMFFEDSN
jgi:hypothetical protein